MDDFDDAVFGIDDDALLRLFLLTVCVQSQLPEQRNPSLFDQRLAWTNYADKHTARGTI